MQLAIFWRKNSLKAVKKMNSLESYQKQLTCKIFFKYYLGDNIFNIFIKKELKDQSYISLPSFINPLFSIYKSTKISSSSSMDSTQIDSSSDDTFFTLQDPSFSFVPIPKLVLNYTVNLFYLHWTKLLLDSR